MSRQGAPGVIYLLHFERPYKHAAHYLGWAADLEARLALHDRGQGARLLAVVKAAGISWSLARTWSGDRNRERQIKRMGGLSRRCPDCGVTPRIPQAIQLGRAAVRPGEPAGCRPGSHELEAKAGGESVPAATYGLEQSMAAEVGRRAVIPVDVAVGERLKVADGSHPLSDLDQGQPVGVDATKAAADRATAVRSESCDCPARIGEPCTPTGDHLARYLNAAKTGVVGREAVMAVIDELDVFTRQTVIRSSGERSAEMSGAAPPDGSQILPGHVFDPEGVEGDPRTIRWPALVLGELEAGS